MLAGAASAGAPAAIRVVDAVVRRPPPGLSVAAVFMTIRNDGAARKLVGASSPVAGAVELHAQSHEGGVLRMRQVRAIDVPGHGEAVLAPGGLHLMLVGLTRRPTDGEVIPVTLTFDDGRRLTVEAVVGRP